MKKTILIFLTIWTSSFVFCQSANYEDPIEPDFLLEIYGKDTLVDYVLENREKFRFQFMLTEIEEVDSTLVLGKTHNYAVPEWYFYPASVVKLPTAILTLEKLKEKDFPVESFLVIRGDFECGNMSFVEDSYEKNMTIKGMMRELIIVSNNMYYNSLYHFLTPKYLNEQLQAKGIRNTHIYKDFSGCEMPLNMKTHGYFLVDRKKSIALKEDQSEFPLSEFAAHYSYDSTKLLGSKHEYRRNIVNGPFDFNYNLEYPISDIHGTSMRLFFPQFFKEDERWNIREEDRDLLIETMKSMPRDLNEKKYSDKKKYPDNLYKYLIHGDDNSKYNSVVTYSKLGLSYGFVTETAYVHDPSTNRRYVLTVSMYVNENDTVNDGKYEYEELAKPFLARFGQLILER